METTQRQNTLKKCFYFNELWDHMNLVIEHKYKYVEILKFEHLHIWNKHLHLTKDTYSNHVIRLRSLHTYMCYCFEWYKFCIKHYVFTPS